MQDNEKVTFFSRFKAWVVNYVHIIFLAFSGMIADNITILSSGLVYSTLIAIVPCVTFIVAFLSMVGLLESFISSMTELLASVFGQETAVLMVDLLSGFSSNAMSLGLFGLISFIISAIFLVNKIYTVFNQIFRSQPRTGTLRRYTTFFTFLIVGVFLLAVMLSVNSMAATYLANLLGNAKTSHWHRLFSIVVPIAVTWLFLLLLYLCVPNAKVRFHSAMLGANSGLLSLYVAVLVFKRIVATSVSYSVIYGSLAAIFFLLLFLYICWYIILLCGKITYIHQFRPDRAQLQGRPETPARQFSEAIDIVMLIGDAYRKGKGPLLVKDITKQLAMSPQSAFTHLQTLEEGKFVLPVNNKRTAYVPACPLDQIYIKSLAHTVYGMEGLGEIDTAGDAVAEQISKLGIDSLENLTLENLLERI